MDGTLRILRRALVVGGIGFAAGALARSRPGA